MVASAAACASNVLAVRSMWLYCWPKLIKLTNHLCCCRFSCHHLNQMDDLPFVHSKRYETTHNTHKHYLLCEMHSYGSMNTQCLVLYGIILWSLINAYIALHRCSATGGAISLLALHADFAQFCDHYFACALARSTLATNPTVQMRPEGLFQIRLLT